MGGTLMRFPAIESVAIKTIIIPTNKALAGGQSRNREPTGPTLPGHLSYSHNLCSLLSIMAPAGTLRGEPQSVTRLHIWQFAFTRGQWFHTK